MTEPLTTDTARGSARPRIATVGVHILDTLGAPVDHLPSGQNSLRLQEIRVAPAGTAAGVAVDLALLGADVSTFGAVGNDEIGAFLLSSLRGHGIDTAGVVHLDGVQTSASILLVRPNGDRPALHVKGANGIATWDDLGPPDLEGFAGVHIGGLDAMSALDRPRSLEVMRAARASGAVVSLDFQSSAQWLEADLLELLPGADYFMPNLEQAVGLVGDGTPEEVAGRLLEHGPRAVVVTCGEHGAVYRDADRVVHQPAFRVEVVDTTGCGDSFCATFLLSTVRGDSVEDSLRRASGAAALVASGLGSDGLLEDWDQLERFVRDAPVLIP
ncbi:carbohydrate kinase family protein [Nocardioides lijunqiniae]|uniref:carbohydrate kinase family protein n=1 Tax=Nocardioides lijunqiniae TaxID=2760832 RepID=UPI001877BB52|nr:carbohydrate kinase family protein [Nocardioides lijunqiniae]